MSDLSLEIKLATKPTAMLCQPAVLVIHFWVPKVVHWLNHVRNILAFSQLLLARLSMSLLDLVSGFTARVADAWYGPPLVADVTGTEEEYLARYHDVSPAGCGATTTMSKPKPTVLGEGAFGSVRLVRDVCANDDGIQYAVKVLCKGYVINDDNTVYRPPKPGVLATEVEILRRLQGKEHNLSLVGVYEGRRYLYLVTELCLGGDLHGFWSACLQHCLGKGEAKSSVATSLLPADIVREVTIKILTAVEHCHKHGVIHRDLKPANVMFKRAFDPNGNVSPIEFVDDLRLIDYGSGAYDPPQALSSGSSQHTTMAGSAFYNSPDMFARKYTNKTDVWSAGVVVYVFAAGFPDGDRLQSVFDTMHKAPSKGERDLKGGMIPPGVASSLPDSFWQLLEKSLLVYRHRDRPSAGEAIKSSEFLTS